MFRDLLKTVFNVWVFLGGVLLAGALIGLTLWGLDQARSAGSSPVQAIPKLTVIPAASPTPEIVLRPTASPTPTPEVPPSPPPGTFAIGGFVQISNTGETGLNMRDAPTLQGTIRYVGLESEVFEVRDGPVQADGFVWWFLVGFSDPGRSG